MPLRVRSHLVLLVLAALLPSIAFSVGIITLFSRQEQEHVQRGLIETARALAVAVDAELNGAVLMLEPLGASRALDTSDLPRFYEVAQRVLRKQPRWSSIALTDLSGQQLLNLLRPLGTTLPPLASRETLEQVLRTRRPAVSDFHVGPIAGQPLIFIQVPVIRGGAVRYVLGASMRLVVLSSLLAAQKSPPDWTGTIIDRNGVILATTRSPEQFIGKPAPAALVGRARESGEGIFADSASDGGQASGAFSRSDLSGWTVALSIPASSLNAPRRRFLTAIGAGGVAFLLVSMGLALVFGRRISRAISALSAQAVTMGRGEALHADARSPVSEVNDVTRVVREVIAERRHMEEVLTASERKFRSLIENALDIVTVLDADLRIRYESPAIERVLGYRPEELVGASALDYVHPDDAARTAAVLAAGVAEPGFTATLEFRFRHRDGSWRILEGSGRSLLADPAIEGIIVNSRDVTERRLAEEALRDSSQRITSILESITDGFLALDARECLTYVNGKAEQILRHPRDELLGRGLWDVFPEAEGSAFQTQYRRAISDQAAVSFEAFYPPFDAWYEVRAYPSPQGLSVYFRDVSDSRRVEERLRQAEKLTTLGELVSGVAHELNNPLTVVTLSADMLAAAPDVSERVKRRLEQVNTQANRAAKIVKNLLTFARQHPPQLRRVQLADLVDQAIDLLAYQLRVNNVEVSTTFAPDVPEITGDPDQLVQVFINLLQNAMQAMTMAGSQRRRITVRIAPLGARVRVEWENTGPGIPPEIVGRVFEPFFTTKPQGQGTGLGLSICYGIVKGHGGEIFAENAPAGGARFVVDLPVRAPGEPPVADPAGSARSTPCSPGARILAVDDEPEIANLLADMLGAAGHTVRVAVSARRALARIVAGEHYDAIILDVRMPDMDGHALYRELSQAFPEAAARVIFTTGDSISGETREFLASSGRPWVSKPFSREELDRVLRAVLESAGPR